MLRDSQPTRYSVPRTRRTYTPQFKSELLTACKQPGASIAALAMQHGMNANVLHRCRGNAWGTPASSPWSEVCAASHPARNPWICA